jgi:hypothetical protein
MVQIAHFPPKGCARSETGIRGQNFAKDECVTAVGWVSVIAQTGWGGVANVNGTSCAANASAAGNAARG